MTSNPDDLVRVQLGYYCAKPIGEFNVSRRDLRTDQFGTMYPVIQDCVQERLMDNIEERPSVLGQLRAWLIGYLRPKTGDPIEVFDDWYDRQCVGRILVCPGIWFGMSTRAPVTTSILGEANDLYYVLRMASTRLVRTILDLDRQQKDERNISVLIIGLNTGWLKRNHPQLQQGMPRFSISNVERSET